MMMIKEPGLLLLVFRHSAHGWQVCWAPSAVKPRISRSTDYVQINLSVKPVLAKAGILLQ